MAERTHALCCNSLGEQIAVGIQVVPTSAALFPAASAMAVPWLVGHARVLIMLAEHAGRLAVEAMRGSRR